MVIAFTLPVIPTAQARPKVAVRGKFAQGYKTEKQKANERTLEAWLKDYQPPKPLEGPLCLDFVVGLPVPASTSRKAREAMLAGYDFPAKKPDLDNIAKQLKDAMTRMQFWGDDAQIVQLRCKKIYSDAGYWKVAVYPVSGPLLRMGS
jgi:Holliday junction resolvase RusA-like endonuclease